MECVQVLLKFVYQTTLLKSPLFEIRWAIQQLFSPIFIFHRCQIFANMFIRKMLFKSVIYGLNDQLNDQYNY